MLNNAFVTVGIKDLWTQKANSIAASTTKMIKPFETLGKKFEAQARHFDGFEKKLSNADRAIVKTQQKFNELHKLSPVNLSNLVNENLSKEINEVDKLKRKLEAIDSRMNSRRDPSSKIHEVDSLKKQLREKQAEERRQVNGMPQRQQTGGNIIGGVVTAATGVGFLRSATRNATEFDTALYDINRQLGDDENIKDYVKFIEKYSLATGQSRIAVAQQTAELRKTLKAGEGLETIKDKIQLMTFATNQLEVDSVTSAKAVEIIGKAFNLSATEMKAFFSQANQMEDFYGAMVTGGDLLEIVGRMPITLIKNMKLMSKESTLMLATFAKANTNLDASAVGYNLGKSLQGGNKARGGGIIAMAEKQGKTIEEYLFSIGDEFKKIESVAGQNDFIELITGTNDMQAKDVFRSLLTEIGNVDKAKVASFQLVQKQFEEGKISSVEYRKEMEKLSSAEKTFVARFIKTEQSLKDFNRTMQLLGDRHEATLGRISESWGMVSGAFGNQVLFPALGILADGLERLTPIITTLINDYPTLLSILAGAGAVAGITAIVKSFAMLKNALLGIAFGLNTIAKSKAFWLLTAGAIVYDTMKDKKLFYSKEEKALIAEQTKGMGTVESNRKTLEIKTALESGKTVDDIRKNMRQRNIENFAPPIQGMQSRPTQGSIDVRIVTDEKSQAIVDVKKEEGTFLNILRPTKI